MTRIALYILFAVTMQTLCYADVTKLSTEHRKALQDSSRFHEVRASTNLPPAVVALCADDKRKLAEPRQKWEATDTITDDTLPRKRLIWAATDGKHYVVHYERGGRGHSFHILVATYKSGDSKAKVVWRGVGDQLKDYNTFLAALEKNKLDDRGDYAH
jgi:predicted mannosyl-3-phosphoglycerate phosphatase (HAD superfamily)